MVGVLFTACLTNGTGLRALVLGFAGACPLAISVGMICIIIITGGAGRAGFRAAMLSVAVICPRTVLEAMVGVGVARIAAKAARCASAMLGIRVIFPAAVLQGMVLLRGRANVGIADTAIFFDCMLRFIIFIVFRACAVATVLIFSTTAAVVTSAIPAMLRRRIILPIAVGVRTVRRAPVNDLAAVPANFFPIAAIPRRIGIVVLAGRIFFVVLSERTFRGLLFQPVQKFFL